MQKRTRRSSMRAVEKVRNTSFSRRISTYCARTHMKPRSGGNLGTESLTWIAIEQIS